MTALTTKLQQYFRLHELKTSFDLSSSSRKNSNNNIKNSNNNISTKGIKSHHTLHIFKVTGNFSFYTWFRKHTTLQEHSRKPRSLLHFLKWQTPLTQTAVKLHSLHLVNFTYIQNTLPGTTLQFNIFYYPHSWRSWSLRWKLNSSTKNPKLRVASKRIELQWKAHNWRIDPLTKIFIKKKRKKIEPWLI